MAIEKEHKQALQKIMLLQSALFFSESSERIIPSCVLQHVQTDEKGQIWFTVAKPAYSINPHDYNFPCRLDFFRKGCSFNIKITGQAFITDGSNQLSEQQYSDRCAGQKDGQFIVRVIIEKAECFDTAPAQPLTIKTALLNINQSFRKIACQLFGKTQGSTTGAFQ